ncbi:hypothetical protein [Deinococcus hopiensis]|uniref:Uncharacterized protein n=1 Tax=Deinococcus hopiensis KR-140 TaxID=695939 RepID=A0A1W1UDJ9_9DEIO|nr:hypothetical protein [Deinococcus hopiensis]SMB79168.1 hypothetical protein SAMN00790413_05809 [Deinococcus hopiensis KR-140]
MASIWRRNITRGAAALLALLGAAGACDVQTGLDLNYRADRAERGHLWIRVRCSPGAAPYRLSLPTTHFQGGDWALQLTRGGQALDLRVLAVRPLLGDALWPGQVLRGDQQLVFEVDAPGGQWASPAGEYRGDLMLSLQPEGQP